MKTKLQKLFFLLSVSFMMPHFAKADVIFQDNFDAQPDWAPQAKTCGKDINGYNAGCTSSGTPVNWSYWNNTEYWNPYDPNSAVAGSHPAHMISGDPMYGLGAGNKAHISWNEGTSIGDGSGWGSDGILAKMLDHPYPEIYAQINIKMQPGFQWHWWPGFAAAIKVFRVQYYQDNSGRPPYMQNSWSQNFTNGNVGPAYIFDLSNKEDPYGFRVSNSYRCNPVNRDFVTYNGKTYDCIKDNNTASGTILPTNTSYWSLVDTTYWAPPSGNIPVPAWTSGTTYRDSNYFCGEPGATEAQTGSHYDGASPFFANNVASSSYAATFGDGGWHTVKIHLKMDSVPGSGDGVQQLWIDGNLSVSLTNVAWRSAQGDPAAGWNFVNIGGNSFNSYANTWGNTASDTSRYNYNQWAAGSDIVWEGYHYTALQDTYNIPNSNYPSANPTYWQKGAFEPAAE